MRVAITHDWLVTFGGGERVLQQLLLLYPDADIFTLVYDKKRMSSFFPPEKVHVSRLQRLPMATKLYTKMLSLMPGAWEDFDLTGYDLFFIGGGQDFDQEILLEDLRLRKGPEIRAALEDGQTFLCICGGYQMMGHYYETADGEKCEFLGAIDFYTVGGKKRMIGNYAFRLGDHSGNSIVVGFENHSGCTWLGEDVQPLGKVLKGFGNNGKDRTEGVRFRNAFCTYSHGPVLPKNPAFADTLLETALRRKYGACSLEPLQDNFESLAHNTVLKRI